MLIAFYKDKKHIFNRATSIWTRGPYSHVELVFDYSIDQNGEPSSGHCFSSSFRDKGTRFKNIEFDPGKWDFIDIGDSYNGISKSAAYDRARSLLGIEYDVRGLYGFVIGTIKDDKEKLFCSESLLKIFGFSDAWRFSPNDVYAIFSSTQKRVEHAK